jgi:hypothetical protein
MEKRSSKSVFTLSSILIILTFIASIGGLLIVNLYRDNYFVRTAWFSNDLVTLFVGLPIFITALSMAKLNSKRAQMVCLGMVYYILYNYAFYLFGTAFNWFFPIYAALFILSIYTFIFGLLEVDLTTLKQRLEFTAAFKWVSGYMIFWAAALFAAWMGQWANFAITGKLPEIIITTNAANNLTANLDLSLMVSVLVMAVIWLHKKRPIGYILSIILNVSGSVYTVVLTVSSFIGADRGIKGSMDLVPLWLLLGLGSIISTIILLRAYPKDIY